MSKERLEEIKDKYKEDVYDCKLGRFDIGWLIEQAEQEHATSVQNTKLAIEFERLQLENKRYREALEFYASDETWKIDETNYSDADKYKGKVAHEVLEGEE